MPSGQRQGSHSRSHGRENLAPLPRVVSALRYPPVRLGNRPGPPAPRLPSIDELRGNLERILQFHEGIRDARLKVVLATCGPSGAIRPTATTEILDATRMDQFTKLALQADTSLTDVIQLARGETMADPRPNKALRPSDYWWLLRGYEHQDFLVASASGGIDPVWLRDSPEQLTRPSNHKAASSYEEAVAKSVRAGQVAGQYMVVSDELLARWDSVQISPFGAVEKAGVDPKDEVRLIHDLKRPIGSSTNEATDRSVLPRLTYRTIADIARRIEELHARATYYRIKIMKGDVKGAFRHLMVIAHSVRWMGALLTKMRALVIDMSAPFGWTSSPTYYGAYGGAITWLVRRESPASLDHTETDTECFYAYEWVDDHVLVELDIGNRLELAASALRASMMAVFGPRALNEKKFSNRESRLEVLGLEFDVERRTISMPQRKIDKAARRIQDMIASPRTTRSALMKLLGSLRHVCTCCRAVKPFFQRIQSLCVAAPNNGTVAVGAAVLQDLHWCNTLLQQGRYRDLPTSMFGAWPAPDIHLYMDASNLGMAVLDPATRRYIQLKFDEAELALMTQSSSRFTINVREQMGINLAARLWGPQWRFRFKISIGQIWCWVDNTTAVAVTNKMSSRNEYAQELNRGIGMAEAVHGFRIRCIHLPGRVNRMVDAASRAWDSQFSNQWTSMSQGWTQDVVPPSMRRPYTLHSGNYSIKAWRPVHASTTSPVGECGKTGAPNAAGHRGCHRSSQLTPPNSLSSPHIAGPRHHTDEATHQTQFCPRLAQYHGIIDSDAVTQSVSTKDIYWPCRGCEGCHHLPQQKLPPPSPCAAPSAQAATSTQHTTAFCGGLLSWAGFISSEALSIFK